MHIHTMRDADSTAQLRPQVMPGSSGDLASVGCGMNQWINQALNYFYKWVI